MYTDVIIGRKYRFNNKSKLYLQFIFIKDLDQVYLNELSEALGIKQDRSLI